MNAAIVQGPNTARATHLCRRERLQRELAGCLLWLATALIVAFALPGCGGGGSAGSGNVAIAAQPADQSVVAGTSATFTVGTSNATTYQWQRSTNGGASYTDVIGASSASYTTPTTTLADSGTQYRVVVGGTGTSVTSSAVTLTVTAAVVAPAISVQPADQTVVAGQNASFSVTASGTSLSYQWQRSSDGGVTFGNVAGATNATLALAAVPQADNGHQFRVVVSNSAGSSASNAALLTVSPASSVPAITTQPLSVSVVTPGAASFSVVATGAPSPTLQWQLSSNGGASFADIAGATASGYTTPATVAADNGRLYRVIATNTAGSVTSNAATLTVAVPAAPSFTTQPVSVTITEGQNTQFTVAVSGTPAPTLQWQLSTDGGASWGNITGATGTSFNIVAPSIANNGRQFRAVASNSQGTLNSNAAVLTVLAPPPLLNVVFTRGYTSPAGAALYDLYLVKEDGTGEIPLTSATDYEFFSGLAPGGRVVYTRTTNGQTDLYSVTSNGTTTQTLANTADHESFNAITSAGRVIYRRDTAAAGRDLWSVNADGTNPQLLAGSANHEDYAGLTAGGKVVYSVAQSAGTDLYVINADGTANTPLATTPAYYQSFMGQTPSGQLIVETSNGYGTGSSGVYAMAETGGAATTLAVNTYAYEFAYAGITRTGQVIIKRNVAGQFDLYGNGSVPLATSADSETYAGSTTSGQVIYQKLTGGAQTDLYLVNADGSNTTPLATTTDAEYFEALTADGRVLYTRDVAGDRNLHVVNADGSGDVALANTVDYEQFKGITSDNRVIYERTGSSGITSLYAVHATTGVVTPLSTSGGHAFFVAITPNDKVLFRRQSGNADLYIINADGTGLKALAATGDNEFFGAVFP